MADFRTHWRSDRFIGDFQPGEAGLAEGCDLVTAVLISLFTHRRAHRDDRLPDHAEGDRRGWWGDLLGGRPIGSRLWLLSREKQRPEVLRRAEDYAREALNWLIEDKLASAVLVAASAPQPGVLRLVVRISRPRGASDQLELQAPWAGLADCTGLTVAANGAAARPVTPDLMMQGLAG